MSQPETKEQSISANAENIGRSPSPDKKTTERLDTTLKGDMSPLTTNRTNVLFSYQASALNIGV